jgi:hypothetical protein
VTTPRKGSWVKTTVVALAVFAGGVILWVTEQSFGPGFRPIPFVERFGFLAFLIGLLVAIAIVAAHLWREFRFVKDFEQRYGKRDHDT